jgi:hypothetical protein
MIDDVNTFLFAYFKPCVLIFDPALSKTFQLKGNVEESKHANGDRFSKTNKEWTLKNTNRTRLVRVAVREISMVSATIANMALGRAPRRKPLRCSLGSERFGKGICRGIDGMMGDVNFFKLLLGRVVTNQGPCSGPVSDGATTKCSRKRLQHFAVGQK